MTFKGEVIWVIGASSGIGRALSVALARQGAQLILSARREETLQQLNAALQQQHTVLAMDVADRDSVYAAVHLIQQQYPQLDRVIFMAATYQPGYIADMDIETIERIVSVNLLGAMYCTHALLPLLQKQEQAQLVFCASVAGYLGLPGGQPYSATKAALINFAESLYAEVDNPIDVKVINPGFVKTDLTAQNTFKMPMIIEVEAAAQAIVTGLKKRAFEIHFPKRFSVLMKSLTLLPYSLLLRITKRIKNKASS